MVAVVVSFSSFLVNIYFYFEVFATHVWVTGFDYEYPKLSCPLEIKSSEGGEGEAADQ